MRPLSEFFTRNHLTSGIVFECRNGACGNPTPDRIVAHSKKVSRVIYPILSHIRDVITAFASLCRNFGVLIPCPLRVLSHFSLIRVGAMVPRPDSPSTLSVAEHLARVLSTITALDPVDVSLADALGCTLALDVVALVDVPNFDNSAMDGYAVRRADTKGATADSPVSLTVVADLPAGSAENPPLLAGQAARIMTGAPMPADADCVVPVEDTDAHMGATANATTTAIDTGTGLGAVRIFAEPKPAAHIRRIGTDARTGDIVLTAGRTLNARDLSAAAATGSGTLSVIPTPRVGVISTGSELRAPGEPLGRGRIHDSNSLLIAASVTECGAVPVLIGSVPDDADSLREAFAQYAPHVDAFVTSGGVSVGAYDVVKEVLEPLGVWFGPVRMQPGKPQGFGEWPRSVGTPGASGTPGMTGTPDTPVTPGTPDSPNIPETSGVHGTPGTPGTPIFALPGNPVSVFVSFEQFVRPALLTMQGRKEVLRPVVRAVATTSWKSSIGRAQFMPAVAERQPDGSFTVRPASVGGSGSYLVASLAGANALAFVPESVTEVREGDLVDVTLVP